MIPDLLTKARGRAYFYKRLLVKKVLVGQIINRYLRMNLALFTCKS